MAAVDFLYEVGIDTTKADASLTAFRERTTKLLSTIPTATLSIQTAPAVAEVTKAVAAAKEQLGLIKPTTLAIDTRAFNAQVAAAKAELTSLNAVQPSNIASTFERGTAAVRTYTGAVNEASYAHRTFGQTLSYALRDAAVWGSLAVAVRGVSDAFKTASDVQLDLKLQAIYNPTVDLNRTMAASIIIAEQWGGSITDVQQTLGLWTKLTGDLNSAILLTNQAEMMSRASGMETQEVYKTSVAIATQYGLSLSQLPKYYNEATEAAIKMALPMRELGKGGAEGMKEIFEGAAAMAASARSVGIDMTGALAIMSVQIQATAQNGKEAATNWSSMVAALEGRGKPREKFRQILGLDKSESADTLDTLTRIKDHINEIYRAYEHGDLGVRPSQYESLQVFSRGLQTIIERYKDLKANSGGKLELVSEAEMATAIGQFDRVKTELSHVALAFGQDMLPAAQKFMNFLNTGLLPTLSKNAGAIVAMIPNVIHLGEAFGTLSIINKVSGWMDSALAKSLASFVIANTQEAQRIAVIQAAAAEEVSIKANAAVRAAQAEAELTAIVLTQEQNQRVAILATGEAADTKAAAIVEANARVDAAEAANVAAVNKTTWAYADATLAADTNAAAQARLKDATLLTADAARTAGGTIGTLALAEDTAGASAQIMASRMDVARAAIAGIASTAITTLGPLAAVYAGMRIIQGLQASKDPAANAHLYLNNWVHGVNQPTAPGGAAGFKGLSGRLGHGTGDIAYDATHLGDTSQLLALTPAQQAAGQSDLNLAQQLVDKARAGRASGHPLQGNAADLLHLVNQYGGGTLGGLDTQHRGDVATIIDRQRADDRSKAYSHGTADFDRLTQVKPTGSGYTTPLSSGGTTPQYDDPFGKPKSNANKGAASDQQQLRDEIQRTKESYSALIATYRDDIVAGGDLVAAEKDIATTNGWSIPLIGKMTAGYEQQAVALHKTENASLSFAAQLKKQYDAAEARVAHDKKGSKTLETDKGSAEVAHDAMLRYAGAAEVARAALVKLHAEEAKAVADATISLDLHGVGGFAGIRTSSEADLRKADLAKKTSGLQGEVNEITTKGLPDLNKLLALATAEANKFKGVLGDAARAEVTALNDKIDELNGKLETANQAINQFVEDARKITGEADVKNAEDAGNLLGINPKDIKDLKNFLDATTKISTERAALKRDELAIGKDITAEQRTQFDLAYRALDMEAHLIPLVKQRADLEIKVAEIKASAQYRATDAAVGTIGDDLVKKLFPANKGNIASTWVDSVLGDAVKKFSGNLTATLFGATVPVDKDAELRAMYDRVLTGQTAAANKMLDAALSMEHTFGSRTGTAGIPGTTAGVGYLPPQYGAGGSGSLPGSLLSPDAIAKNIQDIATNSDPQNSLGNTGVTLAYFEQSKTDQARAAANSPDAAAAFVGDNVPWSTAPSSAAARSPLNLLPAMLALSKGGGAGILGGLSLAGDALGRGNPNSVFSKVGGIAGGLGSILAGQATGGIAGAFDAGTGAASILKTLGGTALESSPIGIGLTAASALFGLFSHHDDPSKMPDKYNTVPFGQGTANLQGTMGANGQSFTLDSQIAALTGGQSEIAFIEEQLAKGQGSLSSADYKKYLATFGESTTGSGKLNFGKNIGQQWISGASGITQGAQDYNTIDALAASFMQSFSQGKAVAPLLSINAYGGSRSYKPNPNSLIGLSASEQASMRASNYSSMPGIAAYQPSSPYGTPGVGTGLGASSSTPVFTVDTGRRTFQVTTNVNLDGRVVATSVNSINATTQNSQGKLAA